MKQAAINYKVQTPMYFGTDPPCVRDSLLLTRTDRKQTCSGLRVKLGSVEFGWHEAKLTRLQVHGNFFVRHASAIFQNRDNAKSFLEPDGRSLLRVKLTYGEQWIFDQLMELNSRTGVDLRTLHQ